MSLPPLAAVAGKTVALEPDLPADERARLERRLHVLGAVVVEPDQAADLRVVVAGPFGAQCRRAADEALVTVEGIEPLLAPARDALVAWLRAAGWRSLQPLDAAGIEIDLSGADLSGLDLAGLYLGRARLDGARVVGCDLTEAYLSHPREVDFRAVRSLRGATLHSPKDCDFSGLDLTLVQLGGEAERCSFRGARLDRERLRECSLRRCDLGGVDLCDADLRGVDLSGADLSGALVAWADFTGARLEGVRFDGVDLSTVRGLPEPAKPAEPTPCSPELRELLAALGDAAPWSLSVVVARLGGDRTTLVLARQQHRCHAAYRERDALVPFASPGALFRLPDDLAGAVPDLATYRFRPNRLGRRVGLLALRALCAALGRPLPSASDLGRARRARSRAAQAAREAALDELRQGPDRVEAWNLAYRASGTLRWLRGVRLAGCALREVHLAGARLGRANLAGADLERAELFEASLRQADLSRTRLRFARLERADLAGADLRHADLTGASLGKADLCGADLSDARLDFADLNRVRHDGATRFPAGFDPERVVARPRRAAQMHRELLRRGVPAARLRKATAEFLAGRLPRRVECDGRQVDGVVGEAGGAVHACRLTWRGQHECATPQFRRCAEANQGFCWHLLLVLLALPAACHTAFPAALDWVAFGRDQRPRADADEIAAIFLRDVPLDGCDFRPEAMLPEDYYAP